ncbi:fasciclin-3 isoform X2 [Leptopilina heterotoma]|uniref:fasciclin-3 isoform X2 n=1 Tax=Leptopilina heterotoma TaxID=63436 RepID=UPI001CA93916|nr:fasciclin-3 isoform X2 [Leptopilina heterotoma]
MIFRAGFFIALLCITFAKAQLGRTVEIEPKNQAAVRVGESLRIRCRIPAPLGHCRIEIPNEGSLVIGNTENYSNENVKYLGTGLDKGDCDILITRIKDSNDGIFKCSLLPKDSGYEAEGTTRIVIAKPPRQPQLQLSPSASGGRSYKRGEKLEIYCNAFGGKPSANVSIYLGDEKLSSEDRYSQFYGNSESDQGMQNVTKSLEWTDHGKEVKCIATHIALDRPLESQMILDVNFPPQPQVVKERFGYVVGQQGVVNVTIEANPQPYFTWIVGSESIQAGAADSTNRLQTNTPIEAGKGRWTAILTIDSVQKSDTEKRYLLNAKNMEGTETYEIKISTSAEPPGVDLDAGSIIGIVIGVVILILAIFLVIFARATGRWCFAGGRPSRNIGESDLADPAASVNLLRFHKPKTDDTNGRRSDTESAGRYSRSEVDNSSSGRRRRPKITFSQLFKRNKDKVSGADTDTVRTNVTVDDEKHQTLEMTNETAKTGKEGLVYAELDLTQQQVPQEGTRRVNDDKTEYAEILYTKPETEETAATTPPPSSTK